MIRAHAAGIIKTITGAGGCLVSPTLCGQSPTKSIVGGIVGAAASSVMDQLTSWMVDAAKAVDQFVMHVALATTTPQLGAAWFGQLFAYMTELGVLLAAVFAVAGIGAAALLHNGRLLGQTLYGIVRAGWGTTVAVALVIVAVTAASSVTSAIAAHVPASFFTSLSSGWGGSAFGGLAAAALAFVVALFTVLAGVVLWLELIFRMAGLYVGVAVLPLVLAAAIYSPLNGMLAKVLRFLAVMLVFPAVAEIVLLVGAAMVGGGAAVVGGIASTAATIVAGAMIYILAAMSPWATLKLVGMEGHYNTTSVSGTSGAAVGAAGGGAMGGALVVLAGATAMAQRTGSRMEAGHGESYGSRVGAGGVPLGAMRSNNGSGNKQGAEAPQTETAAAAAGGS